MRWTTLLMPLIALLAPVVKAESGILYTDAVTYCAEAKAVIVDQFDIAYHKSNGSVTFSFSLAAVESNLNVSASLYLNAYGMDIVNQTIPLCSLFGGVICPLPQVNFTGFGTYPIPSSYTKDIPGIAYTVPNLEAFAQIKLIRTDNNEVAACLQATLSNGKTTKLKAVAIATGIFTLVALLVGLFHAGAITSPSPAQYRWFDILYLYQTAVATGLITNLNYPLVYSNFVQNFAWSYALFYSSKMQNTINKMRQKTGGHLSTDAYSDVQYINRKLSPYNVDDYVDVNNFATLSDFRSYLVDNQSVGQSIGLQKRVNIPSTYSQNQTSGIYTGIPVYTNTIRIPEANALDTVFFWFLALIATAIVFHIILFGVVFALDRGSSRRMDGWASRLRRTWWGFCAGNALRLCLIGFLPLWIFSFWQFKIGDSGLSIFFAVLSLLITLVPLATIFLLSILKSRRRSSTSPTISPLYTSYRFFHSAGTLYRPYRQKYHFFWFAPLVLAMVARAGFIAFGNHQAWAQVIGNVVIEAIVIVAMLALRPHKDRKGDWLGPFLSFCRMAAFGLLIAFIPSVGVKPIPRTIIGFVIIVLFGVPTILLLIGLIWNAGYGYLWRRHAYRIEDGMEVERFVASDADDDSERNRPAMTSVDANNFASAPGAFVDRDDNGASGGRRTSIIEPVGNNVYEAGPHYDSRYSQDGYNNNNSSVAAYERASGGYAGVGSRTNSHEYNNNRNSYGSGAGAGAEYASESRRSSRATSRNSNYQTPMSGLEYYTPMGGEATPREDQRQSHDGYFNGQARY